jgi:hypothetical protein
MKSVGGKLTGEQPALNIHEVEEGGGWLLGCAGVALPRRLRPRLPLKAARSGRPSPLP